MPIIPDYNPTGGNYQPSAPSVGAAMAPGKALAGFGNAIGNAGEALGDIALERRESRTTGAVNRGRLAMQEAAAKHNEFRAANPEDESKWEADMKAHADQAKKAIIEDKDLSPEGRQRLDAEFAGWSANAVSDTRVAALKNRSARDRTVTTRTVEAYRLAKKYPDARKVITEAVDTGVYHPDEGKVDIEFLDADEKLYSKKQADQQERDTIATDPAAWLKTNPGDTIPEGKDPYEYRARRSYALQLHGQQQEEIQDLGREGILSGHIRTEAEIDHIAEDALPSVKANLKNILATRTDIAKKLEILTPEYQNRTSGEVEDALHEFDPDNIEQRVWLNNKISTLPEGPVKSHYSSRMLKALKGDTGSGDLALDDTLQMMRGAFKAGLLGKVAVRQSIGQIMDAKFLEDTRPGSFMRQAGLTETEAKDVAAGKDEEERKKLFGQFWNESKAPGPSYYTTVAQAIRDGHGDTYRINYTDPKDKISAIDIVGKVSAGIIKWRKANPQASASEIQKEMLNLAGPGAADAFIEAAFETEFEAPAADPTNPNLPVTSWDASELLLPPLER